MRAASLFLIHASLVLWSMSGVGAAGTISPPAPGVSQALGDVSTAERNAVVTVGSCSGTLIARDLVLTVAHCLPKTYRMEPLVPETRARCSGLPQQAELAQNPWEVPYQWYDVPREKLLIVRVGVLSEEPLVQRRVKAYSLARCADMALLRLTRPVPDRFAVPLPVLTRSALEGKSGESLIREGRLRYAGWGMPTFAEAPAPRRNTGPVTYWARNRCHLFALPPWRENGQRILPGDSGAPLILDTGYTKIAVGVLFGQGVPDADACGLPTPLPPGKHGGYTMTFRGPMADPDATDLSDWLETMAPEAVVTEIQD